MKISVHNNPGAAPIRPGVPYELLSKWQRFVLATTDREVFLRAQANPTEPVYPKKLAAVPKKSVQPTVVQPKAVRGKLDRDPRSLHKRDLAHKTLVALGAQVVDGRVVMAAKPRAEGPMLRWSEMSPKQRSWLLASAPSTAAALQKAPHWAASVPPDTTTPPTRAA